MKSKKTDLGAIIEKGLKLMFDRLLEKAIQENRELIIGDSNGKPISIKASKLKASLK